MDSPLQSLILSASLGALIGLIRQWGEQQDEHKGDYHFAGLRTFVLWALIGYSSAFISENYAPLAFIAGILVVGLHLVLFGVHHHGRRHRDPLPRRPGLLEPPFTGGDARGDHHTRPRAETEEPLLDAPVYR